MSKMWAKRIGFRIAYYLGVIRLFSFLNRKKIVILVYHGVREEESSDGIRNHWGDHLCAGKFRKQIEYLATHRKILPLAEVVDLLKQRREIPPYTAAVTFDDGYRNNLVHAWPVLRSWGVPATIFLSTRWLDTREMLWFDKVEYAIENVRDRESIDLEIRGQPHRYSLNSRDERIRACAQIKILCKSVPDDTKEEVIEQLGNICGNLFDTPAGDDYAPLSWAEITELHSNRFISFGAHGDRHCILSKVTPEEARQEISVSKQKIECHLGKTVPFFAYPNGGVGDFNKETEQILDDVGFIGGLTGIPGVNDHSVNSFELRRICINNNGDFFDFLARLSGFAAFLVRLKSLLVRSRRMRAARQESSCEQVNKVNAGNVLSSSRGIGNTVQRAATIFNRFGISARKMEALLNKYVDITEKFGVVPTFPVTAVTLKRHPEVVRHLARRGVELAVHGYIHTDHKLLSSKEQTRHFKKAIDTFESYHIPFVGFRAPYLRSNGATLEALSSLKLAYDSSRVMHWDVVDRTKYSRKGQSEYGRLLDFYQPLDTGHYLSLPRFEDGLVEIPVSIPDDESMVERLGITDEQEIADIWETIFRGTYARGELFAVQLHPERISLCETALESIMQQAREFNPHVWIATLGEIAEWWKERDKFTFELNHKGNREWMIKANCSAKATVLLRNCKANKPTADWASGYQSIDDRDFVVESPARPLIGVGTNCSPDAVAFLKGEGFVVEVSDQPGNYGLYFNNLADFRESDEKPISEAIERSTSPLVRYWRWPDGAKSALAITGDIDSITLIDFVMRVFEVWRQEKGSGG